MVFIPNLLKCMVNFTNFLILEYFWVNLMTSFSMKIININCDFDNIHLFFKLIEWEN